MTPEEEVIRAFMAYVGENGVKLMATIPDLEREEDWYEVNLDYWVEAFVRDLEAKDEQLGDAGS